MCVFCSHYKWGCVLCIEKPAICASAYVGRQAADRGSARAQSTHGRTGDTNGCHWNSYCPSCLPPGTAMLRLCSSLSTAVILLGLLHFRVKLCPVMAMLRKLVESPHFHHICRSDGVRDCLVCDLGRSVDDCYSTLHKAEQRYS